MVIIRIIIKQLEDQHSKMLQSIPTYDETSNTTRAQQLREMGDRSATIDMGQKVSGECCCVPFREELVLHPGPRATSVPSGILIHPTVWPQYTNVTDGQDRQYNGRPKMTNFIHQETMLTSPLLSIIRCHA